MTDAHCPHDSTALRAYVHLQQGDVLVAGDGLGGAPLHLQDAAQVVVRHAQPLRLLLRRHLRLRRRVRALTDCLDLVCFQQTPLKKT